jgi:hypothetical protein
MRSWHMQDPRLSWSAAPRLSNGTVPDPIAHLAGEVGVLATRAIGAMAIPLFLRSRR